MMLAAFPFWALRRWFGPAGALVLALTVTAGSIDLVFSLRVQPRPEASVPTQRPALGSPPPQSLLDRLSDEDLFQGDLPVRPRPTVTTDLAQALSTAAHAGVIGFVTVLLTLAMEGLRRRPRTGPTNPASRPEVPTEPATTGGPSRRQRAVVLVAVGVAVIMLLVPPWIRTFSYPGMRSAAPAGYAPVFAPPKFDDFAIGVHLDVTRLFLQLAIVGLVAGWFYWSVSARSGTRRRGGNP
jgi:hypothetical protein